MWGNSGLHSFLTSERRERQVGMEVVDLDPLADVEEAMPRSRSGPSPDSTPSGFGGDDRMLASRRCWRRREATSPGAARWAASPTSTIGGGWERRPGGCGGAGEGRGALEAKGGGGRAV